jgi:hypothetical protein
VRSDPPAFALDVWDLITAKVQKRTVRVRSGATIASNAFALPTRAASVNSLSEWDKRNDLGLLFRLLRLSTHHSINHFFPDATF